MNKRACAKLQSCNVTSANLSVPVLWLGQGFMDLIVVYQKNNVVAFDPGKPDKDGSRWEVIRIVIPQRMCFGSGQMCASASRNTARKWSTKKRYTEIVRYELLLALALARVWCWGVRGRRCRRTLGAQHAVLLRELVLAPPPNEKHSGASKIGAWVFKVPGGATWIFQAADRPQTNFRLKALLRKITEHVLHAETPPR